MSSLSVKAIRENDILDSDDTTVSKPAKDLIDSDAVEPRTETVPTGGTDKEAPSVFEPTVEELDFLKKATRIEDEEELKKHVIIIQRKALKVHPYPHIKNFSFAKMKIGRMKTYQKALYLGQKRKGALMLDVGCGFGTDVRKAVLDGYPAENIIAVEMHPEFWDLGHELYGDNDDTLPVTFMPGSIFRLSRSSGAQKDEPPPEELPPLRMLTSLTPLKGRLSVIYVSNMFHYFDRKHQEELADILGSLLSLQKASMIFGSHIGAPVAGGGDEVVPHFAHNEKSWEELWQRVLGKDKCVVKARLKEVPEWVQKIGVGTHVLYWSVERPMP